MRWVERAGRLRYENDEEAPRRAPKCQSAEAHLDAWGVLGRRGASGCQVSVKAQLLLHPEPKGDTVRARSTPALSKRFTLSEVFEVI